MVRVPLLVRLLLMLVVPPSVTAAVLFTTRLPESANVPRLENVAPEFTVRLEKDIEPEAKLKKRVPVLKFRFAIEEKVPPL